MHCSWPLSCRYISVSHKSQWRFTVDIFLCIATSDTVTHDDSLPSFLICCLLLKNLPFSHIRPFLPLFATISPDKSHLPGGRNAFVAIEDSGQIRPCWWEHYRSRFWEKPDILKSCNNWFCPAVQDQRASKLHSMFKVKAFWSAAASRGWINK